MAAKRAAGKSFPRPVESSANRFVYVEACVAVCSVGLGLSQMEVETGLLISRTPKPHASQPVFSPHGP